MPGDVRVGIVGCGAVVQRNYSKALLGIPGIHVVATNDLDEEAAGIVAKQHGARAMSFDQVVGSVDAVILATPPSTHIELARAALSRGRVVLCEKPFTRTAQDAVELVQLAHARGSRISLNHLRRAFRSVRGARDFVRGGLLGRLVAIDAAEGGRFGWASASGYVSRDPAGGVLYDTGSHTLDTALFVSGLDSVPLTVVGAEAWRDRDEPSHEFTGHFRLRAGDSEVRGSIRLSRKRVLANRVRLTFEGGVLDVPIGPKPRFRVTRGSASVALMTEFGPGDYDHYFRETFQRTLRPGGDADFDGGRFVGLAALLEALATASGGR